MTESIAAWKSLQYDSFMAERGYDLNPPEDIDAQWETYYNNLEAAIIEREHIQLLDETGS